MKTVSIVMRSRNDVLFAERTIDAVFSQKFTDFEFLSFDNASTDGTAEIIAKYPSIKKYEVAEGTYVPGKVLNRAVSECSGKIIVFNNADAIPLSPDWLGNLIEPILSGKADAVYARQMPREDADIWVSLDYSRSFSDSEFSDSFFSLASSAVSAELLAKIPFDDKIKYSEDVHFAERIKRGGYKVAYAPSATVEHSHNYTEEQARKRFSGEGRADAEILGSPQSVLGLAKGVVGGFVRDAAYIAKNGKISSLVPCLRRRLAQKWCYYKARNDAFRERNK